MNYKKAIQQIISSRNTVLLRAENLYKTLLDNPRFYEVEKQLRELTLDSLSLNTDNDKKIKELNSQRNKILKEMNITQNDLFPKPKCYICNDSGLVGGKTCKCAKNIAISSLDASVTLPIHSFDDADMNIFDAQTRPQMEKLYETMRVFCDKFPNTNKKNIILLGSTGVGKTHLVSCIAGEIISKGESVVFTSAFGFVNSMLKYHTTFDEQKLLYLSPLLDCSLLIIDDLGTESILKNITLEYLYLILNERTISNKHTIFTSNLTMEQIDKRYGSRICSRIFDKKLCFIGSIIGKDIRII